MSAIALAWTRRKRRKRRKPGPLQWVILLVFAWFGVKRGLLDLLDGDWHGLVIDWLLAWFCWGRTPIINYYFHKYLDRDDSAQSRYHFRGTKDILKEWIIGVDE